MVTDSSAPVPAKRTKKKPQHPTWEHPKGSGIKIAEMPNKTKGKVYGVSYQVRIPASLLGVPNKREMHQRGSRAEAERLAEDRFMALKRYGNRFSEIPAKAQEQAATAWGILNEHNEMQRRSLVERAGFNRRTTESLPAGAREAELKRLEAQLAADVAKHELNLLDVVRAGIRALAPAGGLRTFAEVSAELRESKAARLKLGGLDPSTESDFRRRSQRLDGLLGASVVSLLTVQDVDGALRKLGATLGQRSVLNFRNTLSEILRYAKAKQYTPSNPLENFTKEDFKSLGGMAAERKLDAINILTVEETRRLLEAAKSHGETGMLATVVLRLFCGLRSGEVARLDWSEVHWLDPKPYVHIPAGKAKKRRIRHVDIPENALAWLKECNPSASGPIDPFSPKTYSKRFGRISRKAGIGREDESGRWQSDWENNDTRHSFGSYHYALHGDALRTAAQMGHKQNDDVLFAHYRSLVRKEDAQQFFALYPLAKASKVEQFPAAAS